MNRHTKWFFFLSILVLLSVAVLYGGCVSESDSGSRGSGDGDDDDDNGGGNSGGGPSGGGDDDDDDDASGETGTDVGDLAENFTLPDGDGDDVSLSDYKGSVVLLFCAVGWCPSCQSEAPLVQELYEEYENQSDGFVAIAVLSSDWYQNPATAIFVREFIDEYDLTHPAVYDPDYTIYNRYKYGNTVPFNILIDQDGIIRYKNHGYSHSATEDWIQRLLGD